MATIYLVGSAVIRDNNGDGYFQEGTDVIRGKGDKQLTYDEFVILYRDEFAAMLKESGDRPSLITRPISEWNRIEISPSHIPDSQILPLFPWPESFRPYRPCDWHRRREGLFDMRCLNFGVNLYWD